MEEKTLEKVAETEILGRKITMYGSIENPLFLARDVANWIDYTKRKDGSYQTGNMLKKVDSDEKTVKTFNGVKGETKAWFLTEDGLYECCMRSTKPIAKQMRKEIKRYLKSIRMTGAAISEGNEEKMVSYYFSALSPELQGTIVNELMQKNKELNEFYDQLLKSVVDDTPNVDSKIIKAIHKAILSLEERGSHNRETKAPDWWIDRDIPINLSGIDFKSIEKALGFKLFIWQKIYILNGVFCQCGKTMTSILRMLVKPEYMDTPIDYSRPPESKREKMYRDELLEIKEKLDTFGIKTRNVKMPSGELC